MMPLFFVSWDLVSDFRSSLNPASTMVDNIKHIVVIGGGIIGVCTAYYLSEDERFKNASFSVTVVEANEIASGASGKAGG